MVSGCLSVCVYVHSCVIGRRHSPTSLLSTFTLFILCLLKKKAIEYVNWSGVVCELSGW